MHPFYEDYLERLLDLHEDIRKGIAGLPQEALDWILLNEANSMCAIVTHVAGSTRFWIGDVAMQEPSGRDRDAEFRAKGLNEAQLLEKLAANEVYARQALERLTLDDLAQARPHPTNNRTFTVGWALLHALEHIGIHVGHIQIQRQMWEQRK